MLVYRVFVYLLLELPLLVNTQYTDDCCEGVCPEYNVDYYGNDIKQYSNVASWEQCGDYCKDLSTCRFWSWSSSASSTTNCYLKSSDNGRRSNSIVISGSRKCGKTGTITSCHSNYTSISDNQIKGNVEYIFDVRKMTWLDAEKECQKWGGHLATVTTKINNDYFANELKKRNMVSGWIGYNDRERECLFKWIISARGRGFINWFRDGNEPNGGLGENCVELIPGKKYSVKDWGGKWNDKQCSEKQPFICQKLKGTKIWRTDLRCGADYKLPNRVVSECSPSSVNPCCSSKGWCVNTTAYCTCASCYREVGTVSCGGHRTLTCAECPQGHGSAWCNGECRWCNSDKKCQSKDDICKVDGQWGKWNTWTPCSNKCGQGKRSRSRTCYNPALLNNWNNCTGKDGEDKACTVLICPGRQPGPHIGMTSLGIWSIWSHCPDREKVTGFRLRVEDYTNRSTFDNTAVNGIQLSCENGTTSRKIQGIWGDWGSWTRCESGFHITEFGVRATKTVGKRDYLGATNVRVKCSNGGNKEGEGISIGQWVGYKGCSSSLYICGVRALIQPSQGGGQDTALNMIQLSCCKGEDDGGMKSEKSILIIIVIVVSVLTVIAVIIVILICTCKRCKRKGNVQHNQPEDDYDDYVIPPSEGVCDYLAPTEPHYEYINPDALKSRTANVQTKPSTSQLKFEACSVDTTGGKFAKYVSPETSNQVYKVPSGVDKFPAPVDPPDGRLRNQRTDDGSVVYESPQINSNSEYEALSNHGLNQGNYQELH